MRVFFRTSSVTLPRKNSTAAKGSSCPASSMPSVVMRWLPKSSSRFERVNVWRRAKLRSVCASMRVTLGSFTRASSASSAGFSGPKRPNQRKSPVPVCRVCQRPLAPASVGARTVPPLAAAVDLAS
ncbi:Uncharacterised protein [Mycobacteroides abscessus]|nr:Uncharacterised protein [Mycobacteroides abscessus]